MAYNSNYYNDKMFYGGKQKIEDSEDSENNSYYNQPESGTSEDHSEDHRYSYKIQQQQPKESVMNKYNPSNPSCKDHN